MDVFDAERFQFRSQVIDANEQDIRLFLADYIRKR